MENTMKNGLDLDATGFGFRSGAIWRNENDAGESAWFWTVGSEYSRGPYRSKALARASANRYLRSLEKRAA